MGEWPSVPTRDFHSRLLPELGIPVGYAALIDRYDLGVPLPPKLAAIAHRHHPSSDNSWLMLTPRHRPENSLPGQLQFALKWEGVQLSVLAELFSVVRPQEVTDYVCATPTGTFSRRIWFLYEWLTGQELDVPPPGKVRLVSVIDEQQFSLDIGVPSSRHKVLDNLPGTRSFCPMVRKTPTLLICGARRLDQKAREVIGQTRRDLVSRAAAFLLLKDSKSSFVIEGEQPSSKRAARWGRAIYEAGTRKLSIEELERLQRIVIEDARFLRLGLRNEGGFVGEHDRTTNEPIPDHISARAEDLDDLLSGLIDYGDRAIPRGVDPVVVAAVMAFGFVYIHPFEDGNGRIHRWLIHHVLATANYNPPGLVFPVSSAILERINDYKTVLESYSLPLLQFIDWIPTPEGNVQVRNRTDKYYRYFDATPHAEFLYACVQQTVEHDLPDEVRFLKAFDDFNQQIQHIVDMPSRQIDLLRKFLHQGNGSLSSRARNREFQALTDAEVQRIERAYAECFGR
jgi:Fic family protein